MKCGCGADLIENPNVAQARNWMAEVNPYGNLHVFVDDGNLEDHWFEGYHAARMVHENRSEAGIVERSRELELVDQLTGMSEEERFAAYGLCMDCVEGRYPAVDDDEVDEPDEQPIGKTFAEQFREAYGFDWVPGTYHDGQRWFRPNDVPPEPRVPVERVLPSGIIIID